jgi:hypothetical protein
LDVNEALDAIGSTGKGRCWYCDLKLPRAEVATRAGWDVQRMDGGAALRDSIILVCPTCLRERAELGEDEFLRHLALRVCNATC